MKWINNISVLFLAVIFTLSATGVVVFQSHCICTGNDHVSLYVSPDTCEDSFHVHHVHLKGGEEVPSTDNHCHECSTHTKECGCSDVSINFLKLKNEVVFEKGRTKPNLPVAATLPDMAVNLLPTALDDPEEKETHCFTPPIARTSLDFLISINQLKIPHNA